MSDSCSALEPFALRVVGDSMAPEFWDGCVVIVDPGMGAVDGTYVVAESGGEVIFRKLVVDGERRLLQPLNPDYPTVEWEPPYTLKGVVVQRSGRRRSERKHYA